MNDFKNNSDKKYEQKRREKVRAALRKRGILPPAGEELNEIQKEINNQISNNDFSFWETIKSRKKPKIDIAPEIFLFEKAKKEATKNGYDFNLSIEDIIIPSKCAYLSTNLVSDPKDVENLNFCVLDRIDTQKGFVKDNIQFISRMASIMKNGATPEILVVFATGVLKLHNITDNK